MPREYWSLCGPARRPAHCSGLMKGGVPITVPSAVRVTSAERRATPKSDTITRPSESMRMFAPLTSRCTMPHAWAYASARPALEALGGAGREAELRRKHLERHHTPQPDLGRLEHHGHPAACQLVLHLVFPGEHHPEPLQ